MQYSFSNYKIGTVQVKGKGGGMTTKTVAGDRTIFTAQAPGYLAKNRYGLPSEMPMDWKAIREEMIEVSKLNEVDRLTLVSLQKS